MKELRRNLRFVGFMVVVMFVGLAAWFAMTAYTQGSIWASDVHNTRLKASATLRGDITDRDGNVLATTSEDGRRMYAESTLARRALSQTVGDTAGMSGVGVETFYSAQLMDISWGALAGAFLAPFMLGLYWRGVTTASVWACFIWGVGLTVINMLLGNPINPINCGAIAMVGGFPVVWLVSLFTKKMNKNTIDSIFQCYK